MATNKKLHYIKRLLSVFTAILIAFTAFFATPIPAGAYYSCASNFYSAPLTGDPASDMVAIALAQGGRNTGSTGWYPSGEAWCADFVMDCANVAGQTAAIPQVAANAGVRSLYNSVISKGGTVVTSPKAGDLVFYVRSDGSAYCHVGIMKSSTRSVEGNLNSTVLTNVNPQYFSSGSYSVSAGTIKVVYVRPAYKANYTEDLTVPEITINKTKFDVGEQVYVSWEGSSDASGVLNYWIDVWNPNGEKDISTNCYLNTSYSFTSSDVCGAYAIIVTVGRSNGDYKQATKKFTVCTADIKEPQIFSDRHVYGVNEQVDITWVGNHAESGVEFYWLDVWGPDGKYISKSCGLNTSTSFIVPDMVGEHIIYVSACRNNGEYKQSHWIFNVCSDENNVQINSTNFPDPVFREHITWYDTNNDGWFSDLELMKSNSTQIVILGSDEAKLTSVEGIQHLININDLILMGHPITEIDISDADHILYLTCNNNQLTSLNAENGTLRKLYCYNNPLSELSVADNPDLVDLDINNTNIKELSVSSNTKLEKLNVDNTHLTSLDLSYNPNLTSFSCDNCTYNIGSVTTLDLSELPGQFDVTRSSNWQGAVLNKASGTISNFTSAKITYDYDCGNGFTATFTLIRNVAPTGVKVGAGNSKVQVKWNAVEGAESYRVMVWDGTKWTGYNTTATSYMVRNLTNGKKYAFAVKTYANGAYSDTSAIVYATPVAASIIPTGVKAGAGDAKVQVKWNAVTGASSYRVMVWDGAKWTGYNTTSTSYMVRNLTNNKKYAFAVKAYVNGAYGDVSTIVYAVPHNATSIIPTGVKAGAGDSKVQVKWNTVYGASSYRVMVWDGTKWTGYSTTSTSYMVRNLTNGKKYAFVVKAYINGAYSNTSATVYATPNA